jgi:mevalonate kinase
MKTGTVLPTASFGGNDLPARHCTTDMNPERFFSRGKLLLTGEYAVLDGASALALPTRMGQHLEVETFPLAEPSPQRRLFVRWESLDVEGLPWFSADFVGSDFAVAQSTDADVAQRLQQILRAAAELNPGFLSDAPCLGVATQLDFPRLWGLGTSSTLIANVARWAGVDPFALLARTFGGSGYDLACATASGPIVYRLGAEGRPEWAPAAWNPPFAPLLYFVYLGQKQDSRAGIARYRALSPEVRERLVPALSALTDQLCQPSLDFETFRELLTAHENYLSEALGLPRAQALHFPDFPGTVKSLGAWGGDFVLLATTWEEQRLRDYLREKGFGTVLGYGALVG